MGGLSFKFVPFPFPPMSQPPPSQPSMPQMPPLPSPAPSSRQAIIRLRGSRTRLLRLRDTLQEASTPSTTEDWVVAFGKAHVRSYRIFPMSALTLDRLYIATPPRKPAGTRKGPTMW